MRLLFLALLFSSLAVAQGLPQAPNVAARAWLLLDYGSGLNLAGLNIDQRVEPAGGPKRTAITGSNSYWLVRLTQHRMSGSDFRSI